VRPEGELDKNELAEFRRIKPACFAELRVLRGKRTTGASRVQKNNTHLFYRTEGPEREADDWSQQSSEELYNLNTLNGTNSDPGFSPKPVRITLPVNMCF
jgi:hypothetical protein